MHVLLRSVIVGALMLAVALPMGARAADERSGASMPTCAAGDPVVWLNTKSNVYHLSGDKYYGKTKIGKFICASAAKAAGAHPVGASAHRPRTSTGASPAPESTF